MKKIRVFCFSVIWLQASLSVRAGSGVWTNTVSSTWGDVLSWSSGLVADGSGFTADFGAVDINGDINVKLDTSRTIGSLIFGDANVASSGGWSASNSEFPGTSLTLEGGTPSVTVNNLAPGKVTDLLVPIAGTSGLSKNGPGTLTLSAANTVSGSLTENGGGVVNLTGNNNFTGNTNIGGSSTNNTLNITGRLTGVNPAASFYIGNSAFGNNTVVASGPGNSGNGSQTVQMGGNGVALWIGGNGGVASSNNSLMITNGAYFRNAGGNGTTNSYMGGNAASTNNTMIVRGFNGGNKSTFSNSGQRFYVGGSGSSNSLIVDQQGQVLLRVLHIGGGDSVGGSGGGSNNSVMVDGPGSFLRVTEGLYFIGGQSTMPRVGSGNKITIKNGATMYTSSRAGRPTVAEVVFKLGEADGCNNNIVTVTGIGSVWTTEPGANSLISQFVKIGEATAADGNSVRVLDGGLWTNNWPLVIGGGAVNRNSLVIGDGTGALAKVGMQNINLATATARIIINNGELKFLTANAKINGLGEVVLEGPAFFPVNSSGNSIECVISGPGSLTKQGDQALNLTAFNTYTGDTIVEGGTLVINQPFLSATSSVHIGVNLDAVAFLSLANVFTNTVARLFVDGTQMPAGTYGSSSSFAATVMDDTFTGPGILKVTSGPSAGSYASWIAGFGLTGVDAEPDTDFDLDGHDNALEYIMGGNPFDFANTGGHDGSAGLLSIARQSEDYTVAFERASASETPDAEVAFEVGPDMVQWPENYIVGSNAFVTVTPSVSGFKTVTLTRPIQPGDPRKYARLRIVITPTPLP